MMAFKAKITNDRLGSFLIEASERCSYSTVGEIGETKLPDGTRIIGPYTSGSLSYKDTYRGFEWFKGEEEVSIDSRVVWERKYEGGITDKEHKKKASELYEFLKEALRNCPKDKPFRRGPTAFEHGDYRYVDECDGDIRSFKGKERIFYKGKEVYVLEYSGGLK